MYNSNSVYYIKKEIIYFIRYFTYKSIWKLWNSQNIYSVRSVIYGVSTAEFKILIVFFSSHSITLLWILRTFTIYAVQQSAVVTVPISVQRSKVFKRCYSSATQKFVVQRYLCYYINCTHLRNGMYILLHNKIVMNCNGNNLHFPIVFYVVSLNVYLSAGSHWNGK